MGYPIEECGKLDDVLCDYRDDFCTGLIYFQEQEIELYSTQKLDEVEEGCNKIAALTHQRQGPVYHYSRKHLRVQNFHHHGKFFF